MASSLKALGTPEIAGKVCTAYAQNKSIPPEAMILAFYNALSLLMSIAKMVFSCLDFCTKVHKHSVLWNNKHEPSHISIAADYEDRICIFTLIVGDSGTNKSSITNVIKSILKMVEMRLNNLLDEAHFKFRFKILIKKNTSYSYCMKEIESRKGRCMLISDEQGFFNRLFELNTSASLFSTH